MQFTTRYKKTILLASILYDNDSDGDGMMRQGMLGGVHGHEEPNGEHAEETNGEHAEETDENVAGTDGENAGETNDEHAGETNDEHAGETNDEHAGETDGENAGEPDGEHAGETDGDDAEETDGDDATDPDGEHAEEPDDNSINVADITDDDIKINTLTDDKQPCNTNDKQPCDTDDVQPDDTDNVQPDDTDDDKQPGDTDDNEQPADIEIATLTEDAVPLATIVPDNEPGIANAPTNEIISSEIRTATIKKGTTLYHASLTKATFDPVKININDTTLAAFFTTSKKMAASRIGNCLSKDGYIHSFTVTNDITNIYMISQYEVDGEWGTIVDNIENKFCNGNNPNKVRYSGVGFYILADEQKDNILRESSIKSAEYALCNPGAHLKYINTSRCKAIGELSEDYSFATKNREL